MLKSKGSGFINIKHSLLTEWNGFEPTRTETIGLAVQGLNHSATSSYRPIAFSSPRINLTLDMPYRERMHLVAFLLAEECIKAKSFKQL